MISPNNAVIIELFHEMNSDRNYEGMTSLRFNVSTYDITRLDDIIYSRLWNSDGTYRPNPCTPRAEPLKSDEC